MSAPIRVAVRADAGAALGTGHFARASAIAEGLLSSGDVECVLLANTEGAALVPSYFSPDIKVLPLAGSGSPAAAMRALADADLLPEVIYLDQYGSVPEWEEQAAAAGARLLVIDDLDQATRADAIVRPHGGANLPKGRATIVLRGPAYLPLSRQVTEARRRVPVGDNARPRLNICFGGSDPTGETGKALQAVANLGALDVDVVIGPGARIDPALVESAKAMRHVTVHHAPGREALARLIADADLALGAGGVMLWERMFLGVPSLVIATAANQQPQIDAMVSAGAIRFLGDHARVTPAAIEQAVTALAADQTLRNALAETGRKLIDGRGAARLAGWIRALALGVRDVQADDARNLFDWRTDDRNWQHNWESADKPGFASHVAWLGRKLAEPGCVFRLVTRGDEPVGVVRFDLDDTGATAQLSIYLVPAWQGRRMGLPVYLAAERALRNSHPGVNRIVSRIHRDNSASQRLHRDAAFDLTPSPDREDWLDASKAIE